jgi:hypothetical protein
MCNGTENLSLGHDIILLSFLDDIFFFEDLESKKMLIFFSGHEADFCVGAFSDYGVEMEIVQGYFWGFGHLGGEDKFVIFVKQYI